MAFAPLPQLLVLNGPNLSQLGRREPEIYGTLTLADLEQVCREEAACLGLSVRCAQSEHEGVMIEAIHAARDDCAGIILNAGAYTHTSIALHDALKSVALPAVEVHLSNIHAREPFRRKSMIAPATLGMIAGFGVLGYRLALRALAETLVGAPQP